jgi:hypothetical protein
MLSSSTRFHNLSKDKSHNSGFRLDRFNKYIAPLIARILHKNGSCSILDLGGTQAYWDNLHKDARVKITLVNLDIPTESNDPQFVSLRGDARHLDQFDDRSFDLVHSNSVIEHVGQWDDMKAMATEVRRLAPAYYVQTPNFWFPVDPHSRTPFIHWLPMNLRHSFHSRFNLGFYKKASDLDDAMHSIEGTVMLDAKQMKYLFPDAACIHESVFGLTKSFIAIRE